MERDIGTSHWNDALAYMKDHPEKEWCFGHACLRHDPEVTALTLSGWEYIVRRDGTKLNFVVYHNGTIVSTRPAT